MAQKLKSAYSPPTEFQRRMLDTIHKEGFNCSWRSSGLNCFINRGATGTWCGYVGVPIGHILHNIEGTDSITVSLEFLKNQKWITDTDIIPLESLLDVHGGLNYNSMDLPFTKGKVHYLAAERDIEKAIHMHREPYKFNTDNWWFGFNTGHYGDLIPFFILSHNSLFKFMQKGGTYRDKAYVIHETNELAKQLQAITPFIIQATNTKHFYVTE